MASRDGDWLFTPFQCDSCLFVNMFHERPNPNSQDDKRTLSLIRRVNLDMFWSSEASTVKGLLSKVKEIITRWEGRKGFIPLSDFTA